MTAPLPGGDTFDAADLVSQVDEVLSSPAEGTEEAVLLEQAQSLISEALEGR